MDPRAPVIVGVAQLNSIDGDAKPVDLMVRSTEQALMDASANASDRRDRIDAVRANEGTWPYRDAGRLVADRLGTGPVRTAANQIGGNEVSDLVAETASDIVAGRVDVAVSCAGETMRTRRRDTRTGRRSTYLPETEGAVPDEQFGVDRIGRSPRHDRPQAAVDQTPMRPPTVRPAPHATIEAYTVRYDRDGAADRAGFAVLAPDGSRSWANSHDASFIDVLTTTDPCGSTVALAPGDPAPIATLA